MTRRTFQSFSVSAAKLKEAFRGIAAEALINPGAHEQGAGIVATAFNATKAFVIVQARSRPAVECGRMGEIP